MPLHVSSTRAHRQEAKIVLYNLWYHHTYRWPSRAQVERCTVSKISKSSLWVLWWYPPSIWSLKIFKISILLSSAWSLLEISVFLSKQSFRIIHRNNSVQMTDHFSGFVQSLQFPFCLQFVTELLLATEY